MDGFKKVRRYCGLGVWGDRYANGRCNKLKRSRDIVVPALMRMNKIGSMNIPRPDRPSTIRLFEPAGEADESGGGSAARFVVMAKERTTEYC